MKTLPYKKFGLIGAFILIGLIISCFIEDNEELSIWEKEPYSEEWNIDVIEKYHSMSYLEFNYERNEENVWMLSLKYQQPHYYFDCMFKDGTIATIEVQETDYNIADIGNCALPKVQWYALNDKQIN